MVHRGTNDADARRFRQDVPAAGYEVCIDTEAKERLELLRSNLSLLSDADRKRVNEELRSTHQYLRPVATAKPPKTVTVDKPYQAFERFASLRTAEACAVFASEYGRLGLPATSAGEEDVDTWLDLAQLARWTLDLWKLVKSRQYRKIPGHYGAMGEFRGPSLLVSLALGRLSDSGFRADQWKAVRPPYGGPKEVEACLVVAKVIVDLVVGSYLRDAVKTDIYAGRIITYPIDLCGALWLAFAESISGVVDTYKLYRAEDVDIEGYDSRIWFLQGVDTKKHNKHSRVRCYFKYFLNCNFIQLLALQHKKPPLIYIDNTCRRLKAV